MWLTCKPGSDLEEASPEVTLERPQAALWRAGGLRRVSDLGHAGTVLRMIRLCVIITSRRAGLPHKDRLTGAELPLPLPSPPRDPAGRPEFARVIEVDSGDGERPDARRGSGVPPAAATSAASRPSGDSVMDPARLRPMLSEPTRSMEAVGVFTCEPWCQRRCMPAPSAWSDPSPTRSTASPAHPQAPPVISAYRRPPEGPHARSKCLGLARAAPLHAPVRLAAAARVLAHQRRP